VTCNPDADSWVADFLAWWIDPETGLPIPERAGVLRYYIRVAEKIVWADRPDDLMQYLPRPKDLPPPGIDPPRPISVTFIAATVLDNPALLQVNPEYFACLLSLPLLERERLLGGNWKIRPAAGLYFKREWCAPSTRFQPISTLSAIGISPPPKRPSSTTPIGRSASSSAVIRTAAIGSSTWCARGRIRATSKTCCSIPPRRNAFTVAPAPESGDKLTRFGPFSSQCRAGNVKIRRGSWNEELFRVLEGFPDLAHDDEVDACSGALEMLNPQMNSWGMFELARRQFEAAQQRSKPQPTQTEPQPGSVEWFEALKKSR
jgi:hypothetical protein